MVSFPTILRNIRKKKGFTQEKMAQLLNMGQSSYAKWENGRTEPTLKSIIELSKILDISTDELLGTKYNQTDWKPLREFEKPNLAKISKEELDTLKHSIAVELTQPIKKITPEEIVEYLTETWQLDDDEKSILTKIVDIVKKDWL